MPQTGDKKNASSDQPNQSKEKDRSRILASSLSTISRDDLGTGQLSSGQESLQKDAMTRSESMKSIAKKRANPESQDSLNMPSPLSDEHDTHDIYTEKDRTGRDEKQSDFLDNFVIDHDTEDHYIRDLQEIINSNVSQQEKFERLFLCRYGIQSQLRKDRRLQLRLERSDGEDLMTLTQKHHSEYGGPVRDEDRPDVSV